MNKKKRIRELEQELTKIREVKDHEERIKNERAFKDIPMFPKIYQCSICNKLSFKEMKRFKKACGGGWHFSVYICDECLKK